MRSVLFVCTANICRSPTAEGVLRGVLSRDGKRDEFEIASAGTHDYHAGEPPSPAAVEAARLRGYEIGARRARRVTSSDFDHYDYILAMDRANLANLRSIAPTRSRQKIELLLAYGNRYRGKEVPDPYGGRDEAFALAIDMIEDGCRGLASLLLR